MNKQTNKPCLWAEAKQKKVLSTSHQQVMSSHFLGSRALVNAVVALEEKSLNNEYTAIRSPALLHSPISFYCWPQHPVVWSVWVSCPSWVPSQPLVHPQPTGGELERQPWCCVRTTQQYPKHCCGIHIIAATNTKQSTIQAVVRKVIFIPARPSTDGCDGTLCQGPS